LLFRYFIDLWKNGSRPFWTAEHYFELLSARILIVKPTLLIVDDDSAVRDVFQDTFQPEYEVIAAEGAHQALNIIGSSSVDLVITDVKMPGKSGVELLTEIKKRTDMPVILITGYAEVDTAVEAMKEGAFDFIEKPFDFDDMQNQIERALSVSEIQTELDESYPSLQLESADNEFIAASDDLKGIIDVISQVSDYRTNVLITGETGTGKELVAQAIHYNGKYKDQPFVTVNCAALPEKLLESELFGYEQGAFTDAQDDKRGKVEVADGGTLFLDEISETSPGLQAKLLRLIQEGEIQPLGAEVTKDVDIRIIAASNRNLEQDVEDGRFREDLYYRLNVVPIELPPLRDRPEEIEPLTQYFIEKLNSKFDFQKSIADDAVERLKKYSWPGNVRELENTLERAIIISDGERIQFDDINFQNRNQNHENDTPTTSTTDLTKDNFPTLAAAEKAHVRKAMELAEGNKKEVAELLDIHRSTLYRKLEKWGWNGERDSETT
jgi:DNA-binding NtrC family response regulator